MSSKKSFREKVFFPYSVFQLEKEIKVSFDDFMKHKITHCKAVSFLLFLCLTAQLFGAPPVPVRKSELGGSKCFIEIKRGKDPLQRGVGSDNELKIVGLEVYIDNRKGKTGITVNSLNFELADKEGNKVADSTITGFSVTQAGYRSPELNIGKGKTTTGWIVFQVKAKLKLRDHLVRYKESRFRTGPDDSKWMKAK